MRLIKILLTLVLTQLTCVAIAQKLEEPDKNYLHLAKVISSLDFRSSFKDSLAHYTFNVQIVMDGPKINQRLILSSNPSISDKILGLDSLLRSYDFEKIKGGLSKVKMIIPFSIIVSGSNTPNRSLEMNSVVKDISALFYYKKLREDIPILYLYPINIYVLKTID